MKPDEDCPISWEPMFGGETCELCGAYAPVIKRCRKGAPVETDRDLYRRYLEQTR